MNTLFLFFYSIIPQKAILGRHRGASALVVLFCFNFSFSIYLWFNYLFETKIPLIPYYLFIGIYVIVFYSCNFYFFKFRRLRRNIYSYQQKNKRVLQVFGVILTIITILSIPATFYYFINY